MNHTQQRKRRALVAMPAHALALAGKQHQHDSRSARLMARLARLVTMKPETRHLVLAGLVPVREG